jgi:hypothetical protein
MANVLGAILGGLMTGAVPTLPGYGPLYVHVAGAPLINDGPFLHALPEPAPGCGEYTVIVHDKTNYGQVRGKPSLSGRPLWRLITGSQVTICSEDTKTDGRNIPWIWVQFKSQEEPWDHKGYMSFRLLQPWALPPVAVTPAPAPPAQSSDEQNSEAEKAEAARKAERLALEADRAKQWRPQVDEAQAKG